MPIGIRTSTLAHLTCVVADPIWSQSYGPARQRPEHVTSQTQEKRMLRVLVIEDDPAMSQYIGEILNKAKYEVSSALNGVSGLEAIRAGTSQVIILDIFMPEKDGLEVLVEMRRFSPDLPVLVISGRQHLLSESSMSLAKQLGADDVLAKPFTPQELLDRVRQLASVESRPAPAATDTTRAPKGFGKLRERVNRLANRVRKI
jgi:DNA-binding response OmpR family regulator